MRRLSQKLSRASSAQRTQQYFCIPLLDVKVLPQNAHFLVVFILPKKRNDDFLKAANPVIGLREQEYLTFSKAAILMGLLDVKVLPQNAHFLVVFILPLF